MSAWCLSASKATGESYHGGVPILLPLVSSSFPIFLLGTCSKSIQAAKVLVMIQSRDQTTLSAPEEVGCAALNRLWKSSSQTQGLDQLPLACSWTIPRGPCPLTLLAGSLLRGCRFACLRLLVLLSMTVDVLDDEAGRQGSVQRVPDFLPLCHGVGIGSSTQ